jgi:guanosine-3',5'-bis(diphosphate) 3'-pyrophosphohydrolase
MINIDKDFDRLITTTSSYLSQSDLKDIKKAWEFAKSAHATQKRLTGEPYIIHPLQVAITLADWKLDAKTIMAGLLHDTIEDCGVEKREIQKLFGREVLAIVDGVTNITNIRLKGSQDEQFVENLRKMILAMAKDLRVVFVKLADRTHNMQTLWALSKDKQQENAKETLEIYAPLAERLGMGEVKGRLEDLAFAYVYPDQYEKVLMYSKPSYRSINSQIRKMKYALLLAMAKQGLKAQISGRKKHLYSLWKKLEREGIDWDFDKINDIVALRIIVDKIVDCYKALGVVHSKFKPVPQLGVSDFIAQPKPNGYRSIHTKVFGPNGKIVEIQIRTRQMHKEAEYGIAAHWAYAEEKSGRLSDRQLERSGVGVSAKKRWIKSLVDWQKQLTDSKEYLEAVKFDALKHRNFVFSPQGDVYDLPVGATPIDFAYAVHTKLGGFVKSAKVNGKMVSLDYQLKSGDVVEIIKTKEAKKPNPDWLEFVATTLAKREIKKFS